MINRMVNIWSTTMHEVTVANGGCEWLMCTTTTICVPRFAIEVVVLVCICVCLSVGV